MKLAGLLVAVLLALIVPTSASAAVTLLGGTQSSLPSFVSGSIGTSPSDDPDQLWAVAISTRANATINSVKHGTQDFTRRASRAEYGARSEIWTLANPDTSFGTIAFSVSASTPVRIAVLQLGNVHRTDPIFTTADGAGNLATQSATLTLPTQARSVDATIGLLTGIDDTNMTDIDITPGGAAWGGGSDDDGPLAVHGAVAFVSSNQFSWTWTSPDQEALNAWAAVAVGIRAQDSATVADPVASAVTKNSANLASNVTDDGDGTITERGFVYCRCATPVRGGTDVTDVAAGAGTGAFTGSATGLTHGATYTVRAYAVNGRGTAYSNSASFTTDNSAPTGTIGGPYQVAEGQSLALDVTANDDDSDTLSYSWDVNGDGTFGDATGATPTLTWSQLEALGLGGPGSYSPSVRIDDGRVGGTTTVGPGTLNVSNVAPSGTLDAPTSVIEGNSASVSFSDVNDPSAADEAAGIRFAYDFDNDGVYEIGDDSYAGAVTAASAAIPAALLDDGPATHTVAATVIDRDGGLTRYTVDVTVTNAEPTGTFDGPTEVAEGDTALFSFSDIDDASTADLAAGIRFAYDFDDDGTYEVGGADYADAVTDDSIEVPASVFADGPATHTIRGAVIDRDGGITTFPRSVDVTNVAPTAALEGSTSVPDSGLANLTVKLTDPGDDTITAQLDWGDGTVEDLSGPGTFPVSHTYSTPGKKEVTLTATDSDGDAADAARMTLEVAAPAPESPTPASPAQPDPLICPAQKLRFSLTDFRPRAPFGHGARRVGMRARMKVNGNVSAKIKPRLRYRTRAGVVSSVKLKTRTIQVRGTRELRFGLPGKVRRQLEKPLKGNPVTLVVRARLNHLSADPACLQAPVKRTLRTKVVWVSTLVALRRTR